MKLALSIVCTVLALASCKRSPVAASDYDQQCDVDADCVVVKVGDTCNRNQCTPGAISATEQERYSDDERGICAIDLVGILVSLCGSVASPAECEGEAFCDDGTCGVRGVS